MNLVNRSRDLLSTLKDLFLTNVRNLRFSGLDQRTVKTLSAASCLARHSPVTHEAPIILFAGYYFMPSHMLIDAVIGLRLRKKGFRVLGVGGANFFEGECTFYGGNYASWRKLKVLWVAALEKKFWGLCLKLPFINLAEFSREEDRAVAWSVATAKSSVQELRGVSWGGIKVGEEAYKVCANLRDQNELDDSVENIWAMRVHMQNIVRYTLACRRIFGEFAPQRVVMNTPTYYRWSVPFDVARASGIDVFVYMLSERLNSFVLGKNVRTALQLDFNPSRINFDTTQSIRELRRMLLRYFADRSRSLYQLSGFTATYGGEALRRDARPSAIDAFTVLIPLNVSSDATSFQGDSGFGSFSDFLSSMMALAESERDVRFIFKIHPAEQYFEGRQRQPGVSILTGSTGLLPQNIKVIPADSRVPMERLLEETDLIIAYSSSVCLEAAVRGIPIILCGSSYLSSLEFMHSPRDWRELRQFFELNKKRYSQGNSRDIDLSTKAVAFCSLFYFHAQIDSGLFRLLGDLATRVSLVPTLTAEDFLTLGPLNYGIDRIVMNETLFGDDRWPPNSYNSVRFKHK